MRERPAGPAGAGRIAEEEFSYLRAMLVGCGFFAVGVVLAIFNQFVPLILQAGNPGFERELLAAGRPLPPVAGFGLPASLALFIMSWDNIINVFIQPWAGARSDQTWTRLGRRKPWVLVGMPLTIVGFLAIPLAGSVRAIALFILIANGGMALWRAPTGAWLGDLFRPEARSKANGTINVMGGAGGILALFLGAFFFERMGIVGPFAAGALLLLGATGLMVFGVREPRRLRGQQAWETAGRTWAVVRRLLGEMRREAAQVLLSLFFFSMAYYGVEAGLSSFAVFSLGISPGRAAVYGAVGTVVFLLLALPAGLAGARYGRRRVVQGALGALVVLFVLSFGVIRDDGTLVAMLVIFSALWALVNVNALPLIYDYGDEAHLGAYTGFYYFCSQLAAVVGPTTGGLVVDWAAGQYRYLFLFSGVLMLLAWVALVQTRAATELGA